MVVLSINSANIRIEVKQETEEGITLDCFSSQIEEDNVQIVGGPGSNTLKRQVGKYASSSGNIHQVCILELPKQLGVSY